jgi:uncharacterized membrane-anchored protein
MLGNTIVARLQAGQNLIIGLDAITTVYRGVRSSAHRSALWSATRSLLRR